MGYYRVSTAKQGRSGLGLEAQQAAVADYVCSQNGALVRDFTEVESGKRNDRPELAKALAHARRTGAVLVVAKLDRLSRNLAFLSALMEAKVDFVCVDNPHATRFTIHILAAVAEHERAMISRRTREALQAAKARGVRLGSARNGFWDDDARAARLHDAQTRAARAGSAANRRNAVAMYSDLHQEVELMRVGGLLAFLQQRLCLPGAQLVVASESAAVVVDEDELGIRVGSLKCGHGGLASFELTLWAAIFQLLAGTHPTVEVEVDGFIGLGVELED